MAFMPIPHWTPVSVEWYVRGHTTTEIHTWEQVEPVTFDYVRNLNTADTTSWTNTRPITIRYNADDQLHGQVSRTNRPRTDRSACCCGDRTDPYWDHDAEECTWREPADRKPVSTAFTVNATNRFPH